MRKKRKGDHVVIEGTHGFCTRCGDKFDINSLAGQRIGFVAGTMLVFVKTHKECKERTP